ncbi:MAG: S8 family serine peptidase [Eubacteriales bacterium]
MYYIRQELGMVDAPMNSLTGDGVTIAVIDTGVSLHPDFGNRVIAFQDFTAQGHTLHRAYDDGSHGTHVCGVLAGNGSCSRGKWRGMAVKANLVVAKVLDCHGDGAIKNLLQAIEWIESTRALYHTKIVNISMGIGELEDMQLQSKAIRAIESLWDIGLVVVVAAGNGGPAGGSMSPLGSSQKIITVGCYEGGRVPYNKKSCEYYSGRSSNESLYTKPDLVTMGTNITSCNSEFRRSKKLYENAYSKKSGTSMATPIVSGGCALYLERYPKASNEQLKRKLIYTAIDCGEDWYKQGFGRFNLQGFLE